MSATEGVLNMKGEKKTTLESAGKNSRRCWCVCVVFLRSFEMCFKIRREKCFDFDQLCSKGTTGSHTSVRSPSK